MRNIAIRITNYACCIHKLQNVQISNSKIINTIYILQVYEERYTFQEKAITNLDLQSCTILQSCNVRIVIILIKHIEYIHPTYLQYSDDKHVYVNKCTNDDVQMYIYRTRINECWFTN